MKRFILITSFLFAVLYGLLLVNDYINLKLVFSSTNTSLYKMYRLFKDPMPNEIPIIGSSRAEAGFVPSELSPRAFNYGLSGSGQWETLFHLKAICERNDASLVIVNLDPWGISGKGGFTGRYALAYGAPSMVGYEDQTKVAFLDRMPGTRFYGRFRSNIGECLNSVLAATKKIDNGAILQRLSRNEEEWKYIIGKCESRNFTVNEETWREYQMVLRQHPNVTVVFVVSPVASPWWDRFGGAEKMREFLNEASKFDNVKVIDMCSTNIDKYDLSYFMDLTHLNETGARKFTLELKQRLVEMGLL